VITPRTTRLMRAADLRAFQHAIFESAAAAAGRDCAVVVPTRSAAEELLRQGRLGDDACVLTRDEFYEALR